MDDKSKSAGFFRQIFSENILEKEKMVLAF